MNLHSVTSESNDRGRAATRGNRGGRSRGQAQGHRGAQEQFQDQFQTLTLDSVAVESVTVRNRKRQRFARFKFHNFQKRRSVTGALKIDSGAELNTMPIKEYKRLYPERFTSDGKPIDSYITRDDDTKLKGYGGNYVEHLGTVTLPCEYNKRKFKCTFYLANVDGPTLMGLPTGEALEIIKIDVVDVIYSDNDQEEKNDEKEAVA